jgi:hypothetical protein
MTCRCTDQEQCLNCESKAKPPAIPGFVTIGDAAKNVLNQFNGLGKNDDIDTEQ